MKRPSSLVNVVANSESFPVRFVVSSFVSYQSPVSSTPTRSSCVFARSADVAAADAVAHAHAVEDLVRGTKKIKN